MASTPTSSYLPTPAVSHQRAGVGRELQTVLVELLDLSLIGKQLHIDSVAEREVALGFVPGGQAQAVAASQLAPIPQGPIEDHVVVREITRRLAEVSERVRSRLEAIGEADLAAQDRVQLRERA
jgi:starvation-inducible DNA-binding protein